MNKTTVFVCTSCGQHEKDIGVKSKGSGHDLFEVLSRKLDKECDVIVESVSCLSNCKRGVSVAISAKGKYHWLLGEKNDQDINALINCIKAYREKDDGFIEKSKRAMPVIARIPPVKE